MAKDQKMVTYTPLGDNNPVQLTTEYVAQYLATPTKSGQNPPLREIVRFIKLCEARELNPWTGDAFLIGFDSKDGPQFSLITAHQALLKRAERSGKFKGMTSGVMVLDKAELKADVKDCRKPVCRPGDYYGEHELLVGGWAEVERTDRDAPSYDSLNLAVYNSNRSRWRIDPAGMIVKCAEASALRKAFPSQTSGLYTSEEMSRQIDEEVTGTARTRVQSAPPLSLESGAKTPEKEPKKPGEGANLPKTLESSPIEASVESAFVTPAVDQKLKRATKRDVDAAINRAICEDGGDLTPAALVKATEKVTGSRQYPNFSDEDDSVEVPVTAEVGGVEVPVKVETKAPTSSQEDRIGSILAMTTIDQINQFDGFIENDTTIETADYNELKAAMNMRRSELGA